MENRLKALFDYQKFENNESLNALIQETQMRLGAELSDDELSMISAAGDIPLKNESNQKLKRRD